MDWGRSSNAFTIMLRDVKFDKNLIQDARPSDMPEDILHQMEININSCAARIRLHYDDENEGEEKFQDLFDHLERLKNPVITEFHCDLSVYGSDYRQDDNGDENAENENLSDSSSHLSEESDLDIGRKGFISQQSSELENKKV